MPAIVAAIVLAAATAAAPSFERWDKRIVLIFAPSSDASAGRQIADLVADRAGLADRDMVVLSINGDTVEPIFGEADESMDARVLRDRFDIGDDLRFKLILVGKDGGEKMRNSEPVSRANLFASIDAMPMRQREMTRKSDNR